MSEDNISVPENPILGGDTPSGVNDTLMGSAANSPTEPITPNEPAVDVPPAGGTSIPAEVAGLAPLPADASDDQKREFHNKLRALNGVPSAAGDYGNFGFDETQPIDVQSEDYKYYTEVFHEVGLSKAQAKRLLEAHRDYATGQVEHFKRQEEEQVSNYRKHVKDEFVKSLGGEDKFIGFRDVAERGFKASAQGANLTPKEMEGLLSVMGDDPRFIKIFNGVGKLFREDVLISGAVPSAPEKTMDDIIGGLFKS